MHVSQIGLYKTVVYNTILAFLMGLERTRLKKLSEYLNIKPQLHLKFDGKRNFQSSKPERIDAKCIFCISLRCSGINTH